MTYTLVAAMRDGIAYYYAGTVNAALLALFNETGKSVAEADKALRDVADADHKLLMQQKQTEADKAKNEVENEKLRLDALAKTQAAAEKNLTKLDQIIPLFFYPATVSTTLATMRGLRWVYDVLWQKRRPNV